VTELVETLKSKPSKAEGEEKVKVIKPETFKIEEVDAILPEISVPPIASSSEPVEVAKIEIKEDDWVKVNMYVDINPAPRVGFFNVGFELKLSKLEAKKTYFLPRYVAMFITESGRGTVVDE
jgi:hypothetical protein